jgi:hypothetical protein
MNYVANAVRQMIGPNEDQPFKTQVELARAAGIQPSTLGVVLKSRSVGAETLGRLLGAVGPTMQKVLLAAAVRDAVPESHAGMLFAEDGAVVVRDGGDLLSPLAERYLAWLKGEARRDPLALQTLEMQATWVGLDKV